MKCCRKKSTFSFGLSRKVNNNAPQANRSVNFNTFFHTSHFKIFSYIIKPNHIMMKKKPGKIFK